MVAGAAVIVVRAMTKLCGGVIFWKKVGETLEKSRKMSMHFHIFP